MSLIIDGYNLLHASGILGGSGPGGLERARRGLLGFLANSLSEKQRAKTVIVFDAHDPPWGLSRRAEYEGITIYFASRHADADSLIEELIAQESAPKRLTVVSSDHRLHRAAKRRKATAVDSDRWIAEVRRARQSAGDAGPQETQKPDGPFSPGEVEFWLREFDGKSGDGDA